MHIYYIADFNRKFRVLRIHSTQNSLEEDTVSVTNLRVRCLHLEANEKTKEKFQNFDSYFTCYRLFLSFSNFICLKPKIKSSIILDENFNKICSPLPSGF